MAIINRCENIVFIPEFPEDDRGGYRAILNYCMDAGIAFEYLQNARGQHFVLVIGEDKHLKEVMHICIDYGLKGSIKPNKICKSK